MIEIVGEVLKFKKNFLYLVLRESHHNMESDVFLNEKVKFGEVGRF